MITAVFSTLAQIILLNCFPVIMDTIQFAFQSLGYCSADKSTCYLWTLQLALQYSVTIRSAPCLNCLISDTLLQWCSMALFIIANWCSSLFKYFIYMCFILRSTAELWDVHLCQHGLFLICGFGNECNVICKKVMLVAQHDVHVSCLVNVFNRHFQTNSERLWRNGFSFFGTNIISIASRVNLPEQFGVLLQDPLHCHYVIQRK